MTTKPGPDRATTPPTMPPEPKKTPTEVTSEEELTPEELDQAAGGGTDQGYTDMPPGTPDRWRG